MMNCDSIESEKLKKLIENKKNYLSTLTNKKNAQYLQEEILLLQKDILPIVTMNTTIIHQEIAKYVNCCYETAAQSNCNGLLIYVPIIDEYKERPCIGIANCRDLPFGTLGAMKISCNEVEILNYDGCGSVENVEVMCLPIHELL